VETISLTPQVEAGEQWLGGFSGYVVGQAGDGAMSAAGQRHPCKDLPTSVALLSLLMVSFLSTYKDLHMAKWHLRRYGTTAAAERCS
jgi:hypothetical protein